MGGGYSSRCVGEGVLSRGVGEGVLSRGVGEGVLRGDCRPPMERLPGSEDPSSERLALMSSGVKEKAELAAERSYGDEGVGLSRLRSLTCSATSRIDTEGLGWSGAPPPCRDDMVADRSIILEAGPNGGFRPIGERTGLIGLGGCTGPGDDETLVGAVLIVGEILEGKLLSKLPFDTLESHLVF